MILSFLFCFVFSKYCYFLPIFQFRHTVKELQLLLFNTNNSSLVCGGVRGVMVIVVGNGHSDTSSNPRRDETWERYESNYSP